MRRENELFSNTMHVAFYKVSQVTTVRNKPVAQQSKVHALAATGRPLSRGNMAVPCSQDMGGGRGSAGDSHRRAHPGQDCCEDVMSYRGQPQT